MDTNFVFSDAFLNLAYKAVMLNSCESERDKRIFEKLCAACEKSDVELHKLIDVISEFTKLTEANTDEPTET